MIFLGGKRSAICLLRDILIHRVVETFCSFFILLLKLIFFYCLKRLESGVAGNRHVYTVGKGCADVCRMFATVRISRNIFLHLFHSWEVALSKWVYLRELGVALICENWSNSRKHAVVQRIHLCVPDYNGTRVWSLTFGIAYLFPCLLMRIIWSFWQSFVERYETKLWFECCLCCSRSPNIASFSWVIRSFFEKTVLWFLFFTVTQKK